MQLVRHWGRAFTVGIPVALVLAVIGAIPFMIGRPPNYWIAETAGDAASWFVVGGIIASVAFWRNPARATAILVGAITGYLIYGAGLRETLAAALTLAAANSTGYWAVRWVTKRAPNAVFALAHVVIGLAIGLAVFGATIHFPVNSQPLYIGILVLPVVATVRVLSARWTDNPLPGWCTTAPPSRRFFVMAAALLFIGFIGRFALIPSLGYDDNLLHYRMWTLVSAHGYYRIELDSSIWSVAPFAVDLLHTVVSVTAGADARAAMNLTLMVLLLHQIGLGLAGLGVRVTDRWLLITLFASTPMLANLLTTLQVEIVLSVLAVAGANIVSRTTARTADEDSLAIAALAALCAATKLPGAVLGVCLLLAMFLRLRSTAPAYRPFAVLGKPRSIVVVCVFSFLALHSYGAALHLTGNPLFPLYNAVFESPLMAAVNFSDTRWITGFSPASYWAAFFHTDRYFESQRLVAGFQYLVLLPPAFVLVLISRRREAMGWLLPILGFGIAMFAATQYWRYLFPAFALGSVIIAELLRRTSDNPGATRTIQALAMLCIVANFFFLPGVSWLFNTRVNSLLGDAGRVSMTTAIAPERIINDYLNTQGVKTPVLFDIERPFGATYRGPVVYINAHAPQNVDRFTAVRSSTDVRNLLQSKGITHVVWDQSIPVEVGPRKLLGELLANESVPERQVGTSVLYRLLDHRPQFASAHTIVSGPTWASSSGAQEGSDVRLLIGNPHHHGALDTGRSAIARYSVNFQCTSRTDHFIAQLNWNVGAPYYRLVRCSDQTIEFVETIPVPSGASRAEVYISTREAQPVLVNSLVVETN
jgi:hypothetical protein